jgi:hypothetical protein
MKKIITLVTIFFLVTMNFSFAATNYENEASMLKQIGVFQGTGKGFELDRAPTRLEGAIMFVRLLGAENSAKKSNTPHPFGDVPAWGSAYVGYLYANGLTNGISSTEFGSEDMLNAQSYLTYMLRALDYNDADGDFSWALAVEKSRDVGLIDSAFVTKLNNNKFLRDHVAAISYLALKQNMKEKQTSLANKLVGEGAFTEADAISMGVMGGGVKSDTMYPETFTPFNPYEALSMDELVQIGADGFDGTDEEIAQQIFDWQIKNMKYYGDSTQKPDVANPMRWNCMLPGIFPVSDMIKERVTSDGKIYGLCWDYAAIYCSIADSYGLESKITSTKTYMSGSNVGWRGLGYPEYMLFSKKTEEKGVSFLYDKIAVSMKETYEHYRAEVKIDDQWLPRDASDLKGTSSAQIFEDSPWDEMYNNVLLYSPSLTDVDAIGKLVNSTEGYEGITDDLGNEHRAATIEDFLMGKGLIPYFEEPNDIVEYMHLIDDDAQEVAGELSDHANDYYDATGDRFNLTADAVISMINIDGNDPGEELYANLYYIITGETINPLALSTMFE